MTQQPRPENDSRSWYLLVGALVLSGLGHVVTLVKLPDHPAERIALKPLDMEIKFVEPPKPPEPEVEKPPEPEPPKVKLKPPPVKVAELKPPPIDAPPPPTEQAPEPDAKPPVVVIGLQMSNEGGTFAAQIGNSAYGKASTTAVDPSTVKAYRAPRYVPPGGADTDPVLIGDVQDVMGDYPKQARLAEVEGPVRLKITVDFEGHVTEVVVMTGPGYGLEEAAVAAVKKARFRPAMKNGEPVSTKLIWTYTFRLD